MRFSIQTPQYRTDLPSLIVVWQRAAKLGFRSAWLMDHLYPILAPPTEPILEAWTTLSALAVSTTRIRLGVLVSANTLRHPALLARIAATIDQFSAGRLEVGLGAAWCETEHAEQGFAFPAIGARLEMLDEACRVLRGLWTEERFDFTGRHYQLVGAACAPKPLQRPLPILLGGQGERRALRIVARHANLWNLSGAVETVRQKRDVLRDHCAKLGRDPREISITVRNDFLLTDNRELADRTIDRFAKLTGVDREAARRRIWVGNRDELLETFSAFAEASVDECILGLHPPYDSTTIAMLERLVQEVVPRLR